jgi:HTH-type transcriptional regulator / antitoxin HipB
VHIDQREQARQIGERIRAAREQEGLRQDELAFAAGVSTRLVHQIESGKPTTRLDGLLKVLQALGLTLELAERPLRRQARVAGDPDGD